MARKRIRYIGPEVMKIPAGFFCVRKEWEKASTQIGLFKSLDMAVNCAVHTFNRITQKMSLSFCQISISPV